jgi:hypothetical protein
MEEHRANKGKGEVNEIPEGHEAVSSELVGGVEILKTEEKDKWHCGHEGCDEVFESKQALAGHRSAHKGD